MEVVGECKHLPNYSHLSAWEQFPKIQEMLKHLLETEPVVRTFDVHTSTTHRIASGKAA